MSVKLTSYINFNGNAKEAIDYYVGIFGGSVDADTFGGFNKESGGAMPVEPGDEDKIMHATITNEYFELMVSDYPSSWPAARSESNIVLTLNGDNEVVLRSYWERFIEKGTITQPLEVAPWGDAFGTVTDPFGVSWMFNILPKVS